MLVFLYYSWSQGAASALQEPHLPQIASHSWWAGLLACFPTHMTTWGKPCTMYTATRASSSSPLMTRLIAKAPFGNFCQATEWPLLELHASRSGTFPLRKNWPLEGQVMRRPSSLLRQAACLPPIHLVHCLRSAQMLFVGPHWHSMSMTLTAGSL